MAARRRGARRLPRAGRGRVHQGLRRARSRCGSSPTCSGVPDGGPRRPSSTARAQHSRRRGRAMREKALNKTPAGVPLRACSRPTSRTVGPNPRDDVLTGLATATFPDGTMPEVGDVVRVATNVFSAGQETTVRLLGTALKVIGDRPDIQKQAARRPQPAAELHRGVPAHREPGQGRLPAVAGAGHRRRRSDRRRDHRDGGQRGGQPRPAPLRGSRRLRPRAQERPPAPGVRPRHPQLPRRAAGPRRDAGRAGAAARPHHRHPDLRGASRPRG